MNRENHRSAMRALILAFAGFAGSALAQSPADILRAQQESERIQQLEQQRQQRDREDTLQKRAPGKGFDARTVVPEVKAPDVGPACRDIKTIVVSGAPNLPAAVRDRILAPFLGRCLAVADFERLLSAITRYYVERGFVTTRAYIPRQDLSQGRLEILVVEGVIEKIMIRDGNRKSISVANVLPGAEGSVLNLRDIEQGLDQINRLASNNAKMDILPGSRPGDSVVVINNDPKPAWHVGLSYDNQGSESTGQRQAAATLGIDNLLGLTDFASLIRRESVPGDQDRRYSRTTSFSYILPYGYSTGFLGFSQSRYVSILSAPSGLELRTHGSSDDAYAKIERTVYRDQASRAVLSGTLTTKDAKNYLAGQLLQVSSRKLTVLDVNGNYTTGLAGGVLGLDLGLAKGLGILGALDDPDGLTEAMPSAQFTKLRYGVNYSLPFKLAGRDAAWSSQFAGQYAYDVLYGSEQMLIGGIYTVRGFVNNTLAGDNGYYWRNDLSLRLPTTAFNRPGILRPYLAFDLGRVTQRISGTAPEGTLSGFTVGATWVVGPATLELSNSRPVTLPDSMAREDSATYFRVSLAF